MDTPWSVAETGASPLDVRTEARSPFAPGYAPGAAGLQLAHESPEQASVRQAVAGGNTDANQLTNLVFNARHPERGGRGLSPAEPGFAALAAEWTTIRDTVVRPLVTAPPAQPTGLWVPGAERVANPKSAGGTYLDAPWRFVFHTIEGEPSAAEFRTLAATHTNPPHLWAMPSADLLLQSIPLDRSAYALARPGSIQTNRLHAVQVECWGYAAKMGSAGADTIAWLADRLLAPVAGMVPINLDRVSPTGPGEPCFGKNSPCRMTAEEWQAFDGVTGHRNVPDNEHWDPGQLDLAAIAARAKITAGKVSYIRREQYADHDGPGFEAERDDETPWSQARWSQARWSQAPSHGPSPEVPWSHGPSSEVPWSEGPWSERPWSDAQASEAQSSEARWSEAQWSEVPWSHGPSLEVPWSESASDRQEIAPVIAGPGFGDQADAGRPSAPPATAGRSRATSVEAWAALARALLRTSQEAGQDAAETFPLSAMQGETPLEKAKATIQAQAGRWGTDEAAVNAVLRALSPPEMADLTADPTMIDILLSELSGSDLAAVAAQLTRGRVGSMSRADVGKIIAAASRHGIGTLAAAIGRDVLLGHQEAVDSTGTGTLHGSKCTAPKPAGAATSDCTTYVADVLSRAFGAKGQAGTWSGVLSAATTSSGSSGLKGTELIKALQTKLGWEALFWAPDPTEPSDRDPEHPTAYKIAKDKGTYYGIRVDPKRSVINYRRTRSANRADMSGIERLRRLQSGVLTARGGMHMAFVINGSVYEVHWNAPATDRNAITATPLDQFAWLSGAIAAPPGDLALAARTP